MTYIPLTEIMIRADIPDTEIRRTRYSKNMIADLRVLIAKYGLSSFHKVDNSSRKDYVIYRQRLKI